MMATHQRTVTAAMHVFALAERLPSGTSAEGVRRSIAELAFAAECGAGVEDALRRLVDSLRLLEHRQAAGLRREFQRGAPAISRVLETLQEDLLPALRQEGFRV
jgi:hypothetical protein